MRVLLFTLVLVSCFSAADLAQADATNFNITNPQPDPRNPIAPTQNYVAPTEPNIPKIKYLMPDPPSTLREKVDRLLYGIKVAIPPEYDHYGYEVRRYMAHVAGPEILGNEERIKQELANIANAKIVFKYWREDILKQIQDIEKEIVEKNPSADIHSSFKFNSGAASAFLSECNAWIVRNENMLKFLEQRQGQYEYRAPEFTFYQNEDKEKFAARYISAQEARKNINRYVGFSAMVY